MFDCEHLEGTPHEVEPSSPGYEGDADSPVSPGPGMAFRLALGLAGTVPAERTPSTSSYPENVATTSPSPISFGSASPLRRVSLTLEGPNLSGLSARRPPGYATRGPPSPGLVAMDPVKIPPTLRGSKILDKLNLASQPGLSSPLSMSNREGRAAPPTPLVIRTPVNAYVDPDVLLTPLTPSNIPGAPSLRGGACFDWESYSIPDSPGCPIAPQRFNSFPRSPSYAPVVGSPLGGDRRGSNNPFLSNY